MRFRFVTVGLVLLFSYVATPAQEKAEYSVESAKSKMEIQVSKEGLFKAFAHNHLIVAKQMSGRVQFDPKKIEASAVNFKVEARSLTVAGEGEPEKDRQDVQANMRGEKVLDVDKYPEIAFSSTEVTAAKPAAEDWTLTLSGRLKLHGIEKPIRFPIELRVKANRLEAHGEAEVLQTDYGIKPIKVGGGAVTVKDKVKITFDIVAVKNP